MSNVIKTFIDEAVETFGENTDLALIAAPACFVSGTRFSDHYEVNVKAEINGPSVGIVKINSGKLAKIDFPETGRVIPKIKRVIFSDPATIVFWADGDKTVVKVHEGDTFSEYIGLLAAIAKKAFGGAKAFRIACENAIKKAERQGASRD